MKANPKYDLKLELQITISEEEAGALDALSRYSHDSFIKVFYEFLGEIYMKKYEGGLRSFLASAKDLGRYAEKAKVARMVLTESIEGK